VELLLYAAVILTVFLAPLLTAQHLLTGGYGIFNRFLGVILGMIIVFFMWERRRVAATLAGANDELESRIAARTIALEETARILRQEIAEHQRAAAVRQQMEERLARTGTTEAIGRLAGGLAHDFINLLTVLNGHTDIILCTSVDEKALDSLHRVKKAGEQAAGLTHQLLAFSRKQVVEVRPLNPWVSATERLPRTTARPPKGSGTILLLEGDEEVRELARLILATEGYRIIEAKNGEEAARPAQQEWPVDLLLTDMAGPGMHGDQVAKSLCATCPGLRALCMSGYPVFLAPPVLAKPAQASWKSHSRQAACLARCANCWTSLDQRISAIAMPWSSVSPIIPCGSRPPARLDSTYSGCGQLGSKKRPFSLMIWPSASIRPPWRRSQTRSQCSPERFSPPVLG
jgi:CheY-like chemotaxis protein